MYKNVVVPLDGSKLSETALDYTRALAARLESLEVKITLLRVCPKRKGKFPPACQEYIQGLAEALRQHLSQVQESDLHAGEKPVEVNGILADGSPADVILRYSNRNGIDLVMMSSHGEAGAGRWAMGSVAHKVVHASQVPVWLIPTRIARQVAEDRLPSRAILVPLDGSKQGEAVLPHVEAMAKQRGADLLPVVLLRVCEPPDIVADYPEAEMGLSWDEHVKDETDRAKARGLEYLSGVETGLKQAGVNARSEVLIGKPADEILDYVDRNPVNVIAMTTHGRSGISKLFLGSVAEKVLSAVPCPVLLIRPH